MTQKLFTLTEDCVFENVELNKDDILLIFPTSGDVDEVLEFLDEDDVDYSSLLSIYVYDRQVVVEVLQTGDWIFSREPKYANMVHSDWLPDLFFDLPIEACEIEFADSEEADQRK